MCGTPVGGGNVSSVYHEDRVSLGLPREFVHSALALAAAADCLLMTELIVELLDGMLIDCPCLF